MNQDLPDRLDEELAELFVPVHQSLLIFRLNFLILFQLIPYLDLDGAGFI